MEQYANAAQTTLAFPASDTDTILSVADMTSFVDASGTPLTGPFHILVADLSTPDVIANPEIMLVNSVDGTTFEVARAREYFAGTQTAVAHSAGETVSIVLTRESFDNHLPPNAAYTDQANFFSVPQTFVSDVECQGTFKGDGSGITNIDPVNIAGTIPFYKLPTNVVFTDSHNTFTVGRQFIQGDDNRTPLTVQSAPGFGYIQEWRDPNGTTVATIGYDGRLVALGGVGVSSTAGISSGTLTVNGAGGNRVATNTDTNTVLVVQGNSPGQSANLQEWQNAVGAGSTVAWVTPTGVIATKGVFSGSLAAPPTAPVDANIPASAISFYVDEGTNNLKVRVRYSSGVYKTATVPLV